jgi:hypothetical protein
VRKVAVDRPVEDRDDEHADDSATENGTHRAATQPDDVEEKEEGVVQEEGKGKGEEKDETKPVCCREV